MSRAILTTKDVSYELPDRILFKGLNVSIREGDHIGLVGKNGSGKSTLLRILAHQTKPTAGTINAHYSAYYLPQLDVSLFRSNQYVETYVTHHGARWPLVKAALHRWFRTSIQPTQKLQTLSGGEMIKLHLAIARSKNSDLLLLDEPTNHLDVDGLKALQDSLKAFSGSFIIVSHDPFFLDLVVNHIWELDNGTIQHYGGNYSQYREQKNLEREAQARKYEAAKQEHKKAKRSLQLEQKRAARSKREGRRQAHDRSMSALERGFFKNRASETAGKQRMKLETMIQEREEKVSSLKEEKRRKARLVIQHDFQGRRTLIRVQRGILRVERRILIEDIDLTIAYGDRLVLVGRNGSGKSSLVRALIADTDPIDLSGEVQRSNNLNMAYVDQKYQIVDYSLSLIENMEEYNPSLPNEDARRQLGRFLFFKEEDVHKKAEVLSGGEVARLTFAMVTAKPVDLLVLDEPTNNLDIETLDAIADGLEDFPGALIVVSHNTHFLERVGAEKSFIISNKRLTQMKASPLEPERFYEEMINAIKTEV